MTYVSLANARQRRRRWLKTGLYDWTWTKRKRGERGDERVEKGASRGKLEEKEPGGCLESSQNDSQPPVIYIRLRG